MNKNRTYGQTKDYLLMILGTTLTALATKYILDPAGLVTGGVTGLSIAIRALSETFFGWRVPLWMSTLLLNIPIVLFAAFANGMRTILRTGFVWMLLTLELMLLPEMSFVADNTLLTAVYGGIFFGAGSGILMLAGATSAGTDLLAITLHRIRRDIPQGRLMQFLDGSVVLLGAFVFGIENTLYAIISVYIMGKVLDLVLSNGRSAKMAMIISEHSDEIAGEVMQQMDRGITSLYGKGMYTGRERDVLFCICTARDIVMLKDIVKKYDENAFFVVSQVTEAMGEGFAENWNQ